MKILIVSDSHRRNDNLLKILERVQPLDMLLHLGDAEGSEYIIGEMAGCPMEIVAGNNDFFSALEREKEIQIGDYKIWMTHGHNYYVTAGIRDIKKAARARGADIVMFGHTHRPLVDMEGGIITVNPGSITYPRQEGHRPSYVIMEIDRHGKAHFTINYLAELKK